MRESGIRGLLVNYADYRCTLAPHGLPRTYRAANWCYVSW